MPVRPSYFDKTLLRLNSIPQLLQDIIAAGTLKAVVLASKLGVFDLLSGAALTSEELAAQTRADARGLKILLDLLVTCGYLKRKARKYSASSQSTKWLARASSVSLADMATVWDVKVLKFWDSYLEEAVRDGKPSVDIFQWFDDSQGAWKLFNSFEMAVARWIGPRIVEKVRLPPGSKKIVDVGGGHGLFSILFCQGHPELSAVVLDQPEPLKTAIVNISNAEMGDRISVRPWDLHFDDIESRFDCALLFNLLHNFSAQTNRRLLAKVHEALNPAGLVIIWDNFRGPGTLVNAAFDFFSLAYLVGSGGQTYLAEEVSNWLTETGFGKSRRYRTVPGLLSATRR